MVFPGPMPIPPFNPKIIWKVLRKIAEIALPYILNGKDVKDAQPLDANHSTSDDIMQLNAKLLDYRILVKNNMAPVESTIKDFCTQVFNQICDSVDFANSSYQIYKVDALKRKLDYALDEIDGIFEMHVTRQISLDNEKCVDILKMLPGDLKEKRMAELKEAVINEAIEDLCKKLKKFHHDISEGMEMSVENRMNGIEEKLVERTKSFDEISKDTDMRNKNIENLTIKSKYIISLTNIVDIR